MGYYDWLAEALSSAGQRLRASMNNKTRRPPGTKSSKERAGLKPAFLRIIQKGSMKTPAKIVPTMSIRMISPPWGKEIKATRSNMWEC